MSLQIKAAPKAGPVIDPQSYFVQKSIGGDTYLVMAASQIQLEDEFASLYFTTQNQSNIFLMPPFDPIVLKNLVQTNNILNQCVEVMEVNIDGTGHEFVASKDAQNKLDAKKKALKEKKKQDDFKQKLQQHTDTVKAQATPPKIDPTTGSPIPAASPPPPPPEPPEEDLGDGIDDKERAIAESFFTEPYPGLSFIKMRRKLRREMEGVGYGFLEVLRNPVGEVVAMRNIETHNVRLVKLDAPVMVTKTLRRAGQDVELNLWVRERRFAQRVALKQLVYYKEFGASREVNRNNGQWEVLKAEDGKPINPVMPADRGTELLMFGVHPDVQTAYYLPRWINQMPSVVGSRKAEEQNLEFFDAGGMPPAIIFVQGGVLAKDAADQLRNYLSGKNKHKYRAVVVEAQSSSGSLEAAGSVQVKVERFGAEKANDAMFEKYDLRAKDHVRTGFRIPPMFLGDSKEYNFACYDSETETLTDHGWIKATEFVKGMKVAEYSPQTTRMEFREPHGLSIYQVKDVPMYHYRHNRVDMCVTPKHTMLWRGENGSYRSTKVEEMAEFGSQFAVHSIAGWSGTDVSQFTIPHVVCKDGINAYKDPIGPLPMDLFLTFLGWYVSEGHLLNTTYAVITQMPHRHLSEIRELAVEMSTYGYVTREQDLPNGAVQVQIGDYSLVKWLAGLSPTGSHNKVLPRWVLDMPHERLSVLFDTLMKGDGHTPYSGRWEYSTTSPELAGQVQELALKLGLCASVSKKPAGTYGVRPVYLVAIGTSREFTLRNSLHLYRENYSGNVHCFSTSTGFYVTRRNGKVAIQGNTAVTAYMVAEEQVFQPERTEFDETINRTIIQELGLKTVILKSNPITMTDAENQLKAIESAKDRVTPDSFIDTINKITGLDLIVSELPQPDRTMEALVPDPTTGLPVAQQAKPTQIPAPGNIPARGTADMSAPGSGGNAPNGLPTSDAAAAAAPGGKSKKSAMEVIELANDFARSKGLVRGRGLSAERTAILKQEINSLSSEDLQAFNTMVAEYMFGHSTPALAEIAGHAHKHDHE